jgi:6-phosphogluconolactonase (cycloisomerase 2 family)
MRAQIFTRVNTGTKPAGLLRLLAMLVLVMAVLSPLAAQAQGNYVYVNNQAAANTVSAYSVSATGALTQLSGSPYSTGGVGANVVCYGLNRITLSQINNLLFVANTGDRTITSFSINPASGVLTRVAGSPFPTLLTLDSCQGISLAATPDGNFLFASSNGQIQTFTINAGGTLTPLVNPVTASSLTPNCCSPNAGMVVSPNGQFLATSNQTSVSMFTINAGALTPVSGSPFAKTGSGSLSGLDFSCAADRLYAGEATGSPALADGWTIDNALGSPTLGLLTPVPGTPFTSTGNNSNLVLYSPDNSLLFQSNQFTNSVNSFTVNPDGSLVNVGKFGTTTQVHTPAGMATDATGTFLYVADDAFGVAVFRIGNGGVLMGLSDVAINRPGEIQDLVAYPARSCTTADLTLTMSVVPGTVQAGAPVQYTLNITNNSSTTVSSAVVADTFPPTLSAGGSSPIVNPAGASRQNNVAGPSTVTITTTVPHLLQPGQNVTVSSVPAPTTPNPIQSGFFLTDPTFNGVYQVLTTTANTFTYQQSLTTSSFPRPTLVIAPTNGAQRLNGTVTITTTQPFQLPAGETLTIANVGNPSFNVPDPGVAVTQIASTKFTYQQPGLPDALSGGGSAIAPNNVPSSDKAGGGSTNLATCLVTTGPGTCGFFNFAPHPVIVAGTGANRASNVVTITTTAPHQIFAGQTATISSVANTTFNGAFVVKSVPSPTTFTYNQTAANAISGGGTVSVPATQAQLITFPNLGFNETRTVLLNATTKGTLTNGTVVINTANISNKSTVDPNPNDNTASAPITIGTQSGTTLTVPTATGPYGGNATVTATLKTSSGTPVPNETIGFNFNQNNSNYNAVTDANGVATVLVPLGFTTVGTHPQAFTVTFGGDASFAASSALGDLIVTKAQLTVTADNQSRLYGDPNPPFTYVITGFVNGDDISVVSGAADCTSAATPASPVGTYPITCTVGTLSAQNYVFAFVDGTLTVNPAPLTVNVDSVSRPYGDPNPVFTGTITGIKNGDNITATYSTTATITSFVGTYPITATLSDNGTGTLTNYAVTINNGTLTITPAALVVTANNAARLYGDPNPPFSGTIAGIKNGDNITAIYTTTATPASPIGTYPIIPTLTDNGTGTLVNYVVTANNGSLVISPAPLTVTAANATMPYGGPIPVLTGTIVGIKNTDNITATYSTTATVTSPVGTYPIVPAVSDNGTGVLSNYSVTLVNGTLTVTKAILTVNVNNASMIYGDPLPVLSGTITGIVNGDNITATYSTTATSASPVGTYPITAILSDNGTGALANYVVIINNGVLTITGAPLTVTAANASMIYGDPLPLFTGSIVGIKNGDNITATFSTTATSASPVGTYPIVPTLIDPNNVLGNYTVTSVSGILTINPAPLTVTAGNASKLFNTVNPPLNGVILGIKNADPITATYSTTATTTSPVGTYPITPALVDPAGKLGNYTVTSNNGTLTVNAAPTANFVFVNNQAATGNSINSYSVAVDGTLTALAGSPIATGGLGANAACSSVNRLTLSAGNNLLFVSNGGDQTISAFSIDPTSGALTAAGAPVASGLTLDACSGISLAATPDGQFLMASSNGQIKTFSIGAGGVLSALSTATNSVVPNASMKISANGQFLAVSNQTSVSVYTINGDGSLTAVAGSPFAETGTATLAGLDFSSTSGLLYGAEASATGAFADGWTVGTSGALSAVAGSPFSSTAINSNVVLLSPNDSFLFASNSGSANVSSYTLGAGGVLTGVSSFGALHAPVGMATDRSGTLLYVADDAFGVAVFNIGGAGSLTQLNDTAISGAGQVQDLVAYPPRMASNADLSVAISASSANVVAGQNMSFTITVTNNGADPAAATVTDALPTGFSVVSCSATGNGACIGNTGAATFYLLQSGETQTVTLVTSTSLSIPDGTIANNSVSVSNSSAVDANAANNSASVSVTVAQPITTKLTVAAASGTYAGSTTLSATLTDTANNPIAGKTVNFSLNGTAVGSAVTDTFGLATIPASLVGINAGVYTGGVTASFAGDPNNKPSSGSADLTVNPALLTVTATNATRAYGDPNPAFAFTTTGFVNGETAAVLTGSPSCTTTADPTSPIGSYAITCVQGTLAAQNYTFTFVSGTLTISPAPLTVTAANASRVYGDPNPSFTGTITGIKNGDNITAVYATTATPASPVGNYAITSGLVDPTNKLGNYIVTLNNGTLTVTPAPLTVTAANATMPFGGPIPALTGAITGIKNADNITATYSTTATTSSPVGTYPIVPALVDPTGKLSNYTVTISNGTLTVTSAVLTVTANNASRLYGDPNPVFTGTITGIQNGDNITATYASAATATSAVGTYAIVPTLSDNGTGALANYTVVVNNGVLTVNKAPLTVSVANASRLYGAANPAFTGTITGLKNGDVITASYSTTATAASNVGTYPITPTLSDPAGVLPNYAVTTTNGTLTITPAPLTVTAANASRVYGDPNPVFTGAITGLLNGDNITATYSTTATPASAVGTYPITPALVDPTGKLGNYTVTANNGTLTITPAPLTVTAANATMPFGGPIPTLTGTITGIKNADNITATYSTTATTTSPVGTYPITPALVDPTAKLGNYTVTVNNGTLTITSSVLTVTANNASRLYGDPNPVFTGTITGIHNGDNITATYSTTATAGSPVGTYAIVPTLSDNGTGALANYTIVVNNGVLTVNQSPLTVTVANASRIYGDLNPAFTGTITGIKNGDNISAVYATTATQTSAVGSYAITAGLVDPTNKLSNYSVTVTNGVLTVTPAPLTVTAANATMPFGGTVPALTGTITGIKNADNITATYSTTATSASPAGTYPIVPALVDPTGKLGNYTVTSNNGTLTITQSVLTVTAANASMIYGDPLPLLTGTITGIQNGDNITATYTTVATSASPVGSYAIVPVLSDNGTGTLANYTVVINNGALTISPAPLSVAAANASMIYGDALPLLTGSLVGIKNGDNITAIFGTTATSASPVGTYPIVPTLIDPANKLSNYTVSSLNGILTINPAPLSVTADNASRLFGTPNPLFTGVITGIKNGDAITATYSTTAIATSPVGTYPITPALVDPAGKLGNYTVTSNNGTLTVNAAPTANFVFVNNQAATGNSINGYSVAANGTLTALAGSPVATGGLGANAACSSVNRLALSAGNNLLFVSNGGDQTISAFSIDPTSGALTAAGAPVASGLTLDACSGISLSATPDGRFLMASSNGQIKTFSIGAGGGLASLSTAANPVVPNAGMKISANGQFLAVSNQTSASVYTINPDGSLTAVAGSPFAKTGTATLAGLDFSSTSGLLFGAESSATASLADAWTVGGNGALSAITGSPFSIGAVNSNVVLLSPNDGFLFASNQGSASLTSFSVAAGSLTSLGSFGTLHAPVGMATDRSGSLLFVADDTFGVAVFSINGAGSLSQLNDTAIGGAGQIQNLVAYPPRMASNADLSVAISASSPNVVAGQNVTFTISLTNNGADPAAATVTDALPSGFSVVSCTATGNGSCIGNTGAASFYLLQSGETQTVTLVTSTSVSIPNGTIASNSVSISSSSAVDANAANNSASVSVTVAQPSTTTIAVALATGTYGGSTTLSATLSATSGPLSGKTLSFSLNGTSVGSAVTNASGVASLTTSLGTIGAGSHPGAVTASFAGDVNNQAASGSGSLTVNPASLTITAANASRLYGDPNPAFTGTITGIQNGDNITATYSTTAIATSPVGTYPIAPTASDNGTGALANYTVTLNNATLTVNPALLTVTAANATMVFGNAVPAFTGTVTGIKNGENITASYSTTASSTSNVGTYPIVPAVSDNGTAALVNYTVALNNGTLTVTPAPLTVSAANASMVFGDPVPALSGTITGIKNGNNITATYSSTATSTSNVGTYPIAPTLSDNGTGALANYTVTSNNGTLTISPAPLTVTAANASMIYGDPLPAFSGTITGIKNANNITATYSTTATSASNAGTYPIVPAPSDNGTGALANYTVTLVNGTLTINPAPLTVTAANASMVFGNPLPAFSGTITGIRNADNITASYTTTATSASNVGTYPITPVPSDNGTGKLANYTVTLVNATLTITPAPLTVTAANASMAFGDAVPALSGTITGIKNGNNITGVYTTTATSTSPVGTYPITAAASDNGTGALANYTVTLVNATLTITPAPLTVTASNASMIYGDPVPAFSGTITGIKNGNNITASYSTTATSTSAVGTYPIVPTVSDNGTGALANYTVTLVNATLTINPATLTVTASNASMIYGDPVPALTGAITGLKNGDAITATFSTTATSASPVGTYPVTSALSDPTGKLPNYTVVTNNGLLTISPAPLTVTAANASRAYGSANPAFTGTITGIKNSDNITATFASATDATTNVGTYPIVPTLADPTAKLSNYTVTSTNGTLTITQVALTVTANNATRVYGDPNPAFTGTITGLVNGDNITFSATSADPTAAVGSYPIVPTLVDPTNKLANYSVTSTNGTLTVTQAPLSVSAANASRAYGDPNNLSGTIAGIKNGDNITAIYSTTATATSPVGTYPITPTLVDPTSKLGNYTVTSTNGTLTITPAVLTVTAANAGMIYGDPVPALSGTITGIKNGENITATYSTTATSTSAPGAYPIVAAVSDNGTGALANYTVVINNGSLTISPAPLVVTAANASRLYGDPNPAFTGTITGLKNGDNIGAIFSAAADPTSPVGNYAIIPTLTDPTNKLGNYSVTLNNGVLTVAPAPLSVVAADASRLYGDPNPAFTGTLTGIKNGDNITASFSSAADPTSPVGTYPIVPSLADPTAKLANYVVTSTNGTLTVSPAPLSIQANDATAPVGGPFPTFTGTITGLKNADVVTASYSTTADATSPAGTYPIIPAADPSPALGNYAVTLINGTLTLQ